MPSNNEYDQYIEGTPVAPAAGSAPANEYDTAIDGMDADRKTGLQQSVFVASKTTPDRAAEVQRIANENSLPVGVVERNYETFAKKQKELVLDYDSIIENTPKTAAWLQDPNNSSVSLDDTKNLQDTEQVMVNHSTMRSMYDALNAGSAQLLASIAKAPAFGWDLSAAAQNMAVDAGVLPESQRAAYAPDGLRDNAVSQYFEKQAKSYYVPEMSKSVVTEVSNGNYSSAAKTLAVQLFQNAPQQAGIIAATLSGYGIPALIGTGITTGAEAQSENLKAGVDIQTSTLNAATKGVIEAAFENLGTSGTLRAMYGQVEKAFGKQVAGEVMTEFGKIIVFSAAQEGKEEFATSVAQDLTDYVTGVNPEALTGIAQRALDAGILGAASGGAMVAPAGISDAVTRTHNARMTEMTKDFYLSMGSTAEASKLRQRLPSKQREFVENLVKDSNVENIFVPTQALETLFQAENPTKTMQSLGLLEEYNQAKEAGTDVKIPMATWVEKVVGTPAFKALADDVKFDPSALSVNELKAQREETARVLEQEATKAKEAGTKTATTEQSAKAIGSKIAEQLKAAGQNEDAAVIQERFFNKLSQDYAKAGIQMSPEQLFQMYPVSVQGPNSSATPNSSGQTLAQPGDYEQLPVEIDDGDGTFSIETDGGTASGSMLGSEYGWQLAADGTETPTDKKLKKLSEKFENVWSLESIQVENRADRGKGVGAQMLDSVIREAKANGADAILLNASPMDGQPLQELLDFYGSRGFKVVSQYKDQNATMILDMKKAPKTLFQSKQQPAAPAFYSKLQQLIDEKMGTSATTQQIQGMIKDIKPEERKWSGIDEFLKGKEKVTKAELLEFLAANQLQIQEVNKQDANITPEIDAELDRLAKESDARQREYRESEGLIQKERSKLVDKVFAKLKGDSRTDRALSLVKRVGLAKAAEMESAVAKFKKETGVSPQKYANAVLKSREAYERYKAATSAFTEYDTAKGFKSATTKFSKYTLPGGENYREVLFTLPEKDKGLPEGYTIKKRDQRAFSQAEIDEHIAKFNAALEPLNKGIREGTLTDEQGRIPDVVEVAIQRGVLTVTDVEKMEAINRFRFKEKDRAAFQVIDPDGRVAGFGTSEKEALDDFNRVNSEDQYKSGHWDEANVLAHVRLNDRTDADGKKVLFVEEIQSDWHQEGRKKGYRGDQQELPKGITTKKYPNGSWAVVDSDGGAIAIGGNTEQSALDLYFGNTANNMGDKSGSRVPDAPFRKTWHEFAMKRILRMAAEGGYDRVAWTTGDQQADRYPIQDKVDEIDYATNDAGTTVIAYKNGQKLLEKPNLSPAQLDQLLGKTISGKILSAEQGKMGTLKGDDLKIGGEGMRGFYDKILVDFANKFGKKYGAKVGEASLPGEPMLGNAPEDLVQWDESIKTLEAERKNAASLQLKDFTGAPNQFGDAIEFTHPTLPIAYDVGAEKGKPTGDVFVSWDSRSKIVEYAKFSELTEEKLRKDVLDFLDKRIAEEKANLAEARNRVVASEKVHALDVTPELRTAALNEGFSLFQDGPADPRGQIALMPNEALIRLGKAADASTFFHESGHYFFEFLTRLNAQADTPQTVKDDYAILLKWLQVEEGQAPNVEQLETFARGFESYFMEGKAPSNALKKAFATFKIWLTNVYRSLRSLRVELTPEVRGVMDRLLATDEELAAARVTAAQEPLVKDAMVAGMRPELAAKYQKATLAARQFAEEEMTNSLMRDLKKKQQAEYRDKRKEVQLEMEKVVGAQPNQRALAALQLGTNPDGSPLPPDMPAIKLDKRSVQQILAANGTTDLQLPRGTTSADGFPVEMVAESFGFQSAEVFLQALSATKPYSAAVEEATENMMRSLYPDLMGTPQASEEAIKALHNDARAEMLQLELEYLMDQAPGIFRDAVRRTVRRMPTLKEVRAQAERMIGKQIVREIKPALYQRGEVRAAKEAGEALAKGDIQAAFDAKNRELLNHELFRAATQAKEDLANAKPAFKRFFRANDDLAKTRDMDLINAGRAVLAEFGVGRTDKTAAEYLDPIKNYDRDTYETMISIVNGAIEGAGNYEEISFDDFSSMKLALDAIWDLSKNIKTIEIEGKKVQQQVAIDAMKTTAADRIKPGSKDEYKKSADNWDKTKRFLLGMRARMYRAESWTKVMDQGDQGAFHDYLFNPISKATAQYRLQKVEFIKKYLALVQPLKGTLSQEEIVSTELKHVFKGKAQLLGMLLHTGNNSNKSKLLRGYQWATQNEDGSLDTTAFDAFISRMQKEGILTKADYDFVQGVWNLFEEMKPMAQKAHKSMYGFYFNEVTADEFVTPFGSYRGGYAPAKVDPYFSEDASLRAEKEMLERSNNSFAFPTAGRGATKTRVEAYAAPLQMDLSLVPSHIDWALRFSTIEPAVKTAGKMLWNKGFRDVLTQVDPTIRSEMLVPWLQRTAQQQIEIPATGDGGRGLDRFFKTMRKRSGLNIMALNVVNTVEQITGFSLAAVKVKPSYLRNALWAYSKQPGVMAENVNEKSDYMRSKLSTSAYEVQQAIDELLLQPNKFEQAKQFAEKHGYMLQRGTQNAIDLVVWMGAYDQAVSKGLSESQAVNEADSIVRQTQGSGAAEDVSRVETGTTFVRLFTMFWGYFNMQANLLGSEFANIPKEMGLKKGAGRGLYIYTMGFMIPAMLSALLRKAAGGGLDEDDDDEYLDDFMDAFFNGQFRLGTAMVPGVGQFLQAGANRFNNKWYDDRVSLSPAVSTLEGLVGTPYSVYQAAVNDGSKKRATRDVLTAIGILTGYPAGMLSRPAGYLIDVNEGNAEPTGPLDFTRGLVTGRP